MSHFKHFQNLIQIAKILPSLVTKEGAFPHIFEIYRTKEKHLNRYNCFRIEFN